MMKRILFITALFAMAWQPAAMAACPAGDWVCQEKKKDWDTCRATAKNPNTCGPEPQATPPQGFHVKDAKLNLCEADDGQKFPCGEPTPLHDDRKGANQAEQNRAEDWDATKYNRGMFDDKVSQVKIGDTERAVTQRGDYRVVMVNQGAPCPPGGVKLTDETDAQKDYCKIAGGATGAFGNQADALVAHNNLLIACTGTNIQGRNDVNCATTPNHPECTGLTVSLANGVFCAEYATPAKGDTGPPKCKTYGAYNYNIEEWLTFSQQYYDGMSGCILAKDGVDIHGTGLKSDRAKNLTALTDMVTVPGDIGAGLKDGSGTSTITGNAKVVEAESRAKEMSERFDDGAAYLGYERGELIKRAYKGQSFLSAFTDSPFAEKLTNAVKETVEYALGNPGDVIAKAKEKRVAEVEKKQREAERHGDSMAAESDISGEEPTAAAAAAQKALDATELEVPGVVRVQLPDGSKVMAAGKNAGALAIGRGPSSTGGGGARRAGGGAFGGPVAPTLPLHPEATAAGEPQPTAAAAIPAAPLENTDDMTLFKRVSRSYRRYAPSMSVYSESKAARDVNSLETPQFFKDL